MQCSCGDARSKCHVAFCRSAKALLSPIHVAAELDSTGFFRGSGETQTVWRGVWVHATELEFVLCEHFVYLHNICDYVTAVAQRCKFIFGDVSRIQGSACGERVSRQCFEMEDQKQTVVVNRDPNFGSSLLNDNFGQRPTDDDLKALDPLELEAAGKPQDYRTDGTSVGATDKSEKGQESTLDPLLQNPDGATQLFTDMHGISSELEEALDIPPASVGMRQAAGLTVGVQRLGVTDWGSGTDGGRSGKPQDGVPYGSFVGI